MKKLLLILVIITMGYAFWTYLIMVGEVSAQVSGPNLVKSLVTSVDNNNSHINPINNDIEIIIEDVAKEVEIKMDFETNYGDRKIYEVGAQDDMKFVNSFTEGSGLL